ncbi:DUF1080 domain-containing protein [Muriicola sp. Z0-33]|uniref:DUF1080 domain-containing protein n=1 Tax=Muriicola sp. Z0-33 TaxID=2816957 RepID=UPI0022378289|nr:DUF1080 domain-containing protein [Muriicola sp. Z0-33]MCW5515699.1 DUF1080 domain-containing protein [Muriicola sp. Z0-33]
MKKLLYLTIALCYFQLSIAQNNTIKVAMNASNWDLPQEATFENFDNRETLLLKGGRATVKNRKFANGTIEVDVYANTKRSFAGITFRKENNNMEEAYMRLHKSNQADAVQYTPIFNNESNWQLYRQHQGRVSFKNTGWNTLRIEVNNKTAEVFVNDEKVMSVTPLRTAIEEGELGLFALFTNRFSNFRFTPGEPTVNTESGDDKPIADGIITQWEITQAMPYNEAELNYEDFLKYEYSTVTTEASGLLPISKFLKKTSAGNFEENKEDYIIASKTINADKVETKLFTFDYSDKIIVYLNGKIIFKGNNAFRAKGVQYMGHIGLNVNQLYLPLKEGANQIHCVVIDKANGWGLIGKLE